MNMPEIRKKLELNTLSYYETHLSLLNCIMPPAYKMTPKEIQVISNFMIIDNALAPYRFGTIGKKIIKQQLNISDSGLSNYMNSLISKNILIKNGEKITIEPTLLPENGEQLYSFKLINTH